MICPVIHFFSNISVISCLLAITIFIMGIFYSMRLQYVHGFRNMDNQACTYGWLIKKKQDYSYTRILRLYLQFSKQYREDVIFLGKRCLEMGFSVILMFLALLFVSILPCPQNIWAATILTLLGSIVFIVSSVSVALRYLTNNAKEFIICDKLVRRSTFIRKVLGVSWIYLIDSLQEMIPEDILNEFEMSSEREEGDTSMSNCLKRLWNKIMSKGEIIGGILFILGFLLLLWYAILVIAFSLRKDTGLLAVALGMISGGLGFIAIGMSVKLDT